MAVAFFDLDRTLIPVNSAWGWMRFELSAGRITPGQVAKATLWLTSYHLGIGSLDAALREAVRAYAGRSETILREHTRGFYEAALRGRYRPGARDALARHAAAGDLRVLLTTSSIYMSELVCDELGLDGALCNRYEVDGMGRLTGKPMEPICFGPGKVTLAVREAARHGFALRECAFYSDSLTDRPMLEAVGHPVAVNPDPRLRRLARRCGWEIQDWGKP